MEPPQSLTPVPASGDLSGPRVSVTEIADRYWDELVRGEEPDKSAILARHPEIAGELSCRIHLMHLIYDARPDGRALASRSASDAGSDSTRTAMEETVELASLEKGVGQLGPFRILEVLGQGGMGIVYLAEQVRPVRRRVALKLIRSGSFCEEAKQRFHMELQTLAIMDHPGIARVLEAGETESGRPYFVMEYVNGIPLIEYCDRNRLSIRRRLRLFRRVCDAVQHAHQKGIIHCDLKPSHILVSAPGRKPVCKIIDFGIARATGRPPPCREAPPGVIELIGTPEYMSPEQAEGRWTEIDTRSDIYSLGVILYELVTGALPISSQHLRDCSHWETRRRIIEGDRPQPSARLRSLGDSQVEVSRSRSTDSRVLFRVLQRDLDWITMKAMERDRTRRYVTVSELASDVTRYLDGEPVLAHPPSAPYKTEKFLRRYKAPLVAAAAVLFGLVASVVSLLVLYLQAIR